MTIIDNTTVSTATLAYLPGGEEIHVPAWAVADWQYEVQNGDTLLGLAPWFITNHPGSESSNIDDRAQRFVAIDPETRASARTLIAETYKAAEGVSNDEEIGVLQEAREMLAEILGLTDQAG